MRKFAYKIDPSLVYLSDSQDIEALKNAIYGTRWLTEWPDITGAFVRINYGGYSEVWVTTSNAPYLMTAIYERITDLW